MAKQYIPKISGLLTEPTPVDAPSNSLSEAENVIIDQNGKVQARHGLNVEEYVQNISSSYSERRATTTSIAVTEVKFGSYDQAYDLTKYVDGSKTIINGSDTFNYKNTYLDSNVNSYSIHNGISVSELISVDFGGLYWTATNASTAQNTTLLNAFRRKYNAWELYDSTSNSSHYISKTITLYDNSSGNGTFTLFVKPTPNAYINSTTYYKLRIYISGSYVNFTINNNNVTMDYPLTSGSNTNIIASYEKIQIDDDTFWFRLRLSLKPSTSNQFQIRIYILKYSSGTSETYIGDGTAKFYIHSPQLSKGLDVLPHIITTDQNTSLTYTNYSNTSEYARDFPFMKLIEYNDLSGEFQIIVKSASSGSPNLTTDDPCLVNVVPGMTISGKYLESNATIRVTRVTNNTIELSGGLTVGTGIFTATVKRQDSSDNYKTLLLVKHRKNDYKIRDTLLGKSYQYDYTSSTNINKYYIINSESNQIQQYGGIPYDKVTNAFFNKNSLYLHTEDGLAEANLETLDIYAENRFFTFSWPNFPSISYELKQSDVVPNWLYAGYKCSIKITFYREMGYSDKENEIYESEPSDPIVITSLTKDSIPEITMNFPAFYDNILELYKKYITYTKLNNGRKFGLKVYRTKSVPLSESLSDEYYQCYPDYPFDNFFAGRIKDTSYIIRSHPFYGTVSYFNLNYDVNWDQELNIGDSVSIISDEEYNDIIIYDDVSNYSNNTSYKYIPTRFKTTDTYELIRGYKPATLIVKDKYKTNNKYYYLFVTKNYVKKYIPSTSNVVNIYDPNTPVDFSAYLFNPLSFFTIIKTPTFSLDFVDSYIYNQPRLYTDSSKDGGENINLYAPLSENSIQFKDFRIYYNKIQPLTTTMFVITQPSIFQLPLIPSLESYNIDSTGTNEIKFQKFNYASITEIPEISNSVVVSTNQRYFIDSPVFTRQDIEIKAHKRSDQSIETLDSATVRGILNSAYNATTPSSGSSITTNTNLALVVNDKIIFRQIFGNSFPTQITAGTVYYIKSYAPASGILTISATVGGSAITFDSLMTIAFMAQSLINNIQLNAILFEQSKLTLRLTSNSDYVNEVSIKTYPFYNRQGYYNKFNINGVVDNNSFEYNSSLNESNLIQNVNKKYITNTLTKFGYDSKIYNNPGNLKNQASFQGRTFPIFDQAGANLTYSSANGGLLTIKNITDATVTSTSKIFDKNAFEAPGHVLIQWQYNNIVYTSIISYSSIESDATTANTYLFKQAVVVAGQNTFTSVADSTTIAYLYFLPGTTVNGFPLYTYADTPDIDQNGIIIDRTATGLDVSSILYKNTSTTNSVVNTEPFFSLIQHNDRNAFEIATFSQDGNIRFQGATAGFTKTYDELLDTYTWSIINKFNYELQLQGIPARLRKGKSLGEFNIEYPNGKKIEIKNEYGNHEFFPALAGQSGEYSILAEKTNADWYEKNLINWSRRNIPEITTPKLYAYIGKNTKNIIGAAANVDDLYIFKEDGIWRCTDSGRDIPDLGIYQFATNIVCQAAGSIQEINEEIIFLSQYGFMSITNGGIENISKDIQKDILTLIQTSPKDRIKSFVNESKQLYYCTLINEVDATIGLKSGTYIFNTKTRQWSFMDQEILTGIADNKNRNLVAYRQTPILGTFKYINSLPSISYDYPLQKYAEPLELTPTITGILNFYYISRENFTNNLSNNASDQYDFINITLDRPLKKGTSNTIYQFAPSSTETAGFNHEYPFGGKSILLRSNVNTPTTDQQYPVIDSYVQFLLNRTIYLKKDNDFYELTLQTISYDSTTGQSKRIYGFVGTTIPSWYTSLSTDVDITNANIIVGVPAKLTFNPESGNQPDTNKLFQEYMIHTETANKGALMSFKTDSQSSFTTDRRFVYDATATNRNIFRTYIPKNVARGRYLIRRVKHDLPLENLIITGQTIVMRDSGSTRVQKDKDTN